MEKGLSKNQLIAELTRSPHGKLEEYVPIVTAAAKAEPEFLAHLIAWNQIKGQIRDAKIALPLLSLVVPSYAAELIENSLAHIALQGPRELLRAYRFALSVRPAGKMTKLRNLVKGFLHEKEANHQEWNRIAVQHRATLKELYSLCDVKPGSDHCNIVLFGRRLDKTKAPLPKGSVFEVIAGLKDMSAQEAAAEIQKRRIPFLVAKGALGAKAKDPDLVLALINSMSPSELVNNTKNLEGLGIKTNPALRGAFQAGLQRAATSTKNVLKATRAAEAIDDEELRENLRGLQEKQLQAMPGPTGNWLVLADRSSSMSQAIEASRHVAAALAKMVKGKVWLVFFNDSPMTVDVTGLPLDAIKKATAHVNASGSTSIGCGLQRMLDEKIEVDGIAVVSDAAENTTPFFANVYKKYSEFVGKEVPVYLYKFADQYAGHPATKYLNDTMKGQGFDVQEFDLTKSIDYYAIPNLASTMREQRFGLVDEVMSTRLLTLADVFKLELAVA